MDQPETVISGGDTSLTASVAVPELARGVVVFAHGSGSSRLSPRNVMVARRLNGASYGTVLLDLLTPEEERVDLVTAQQRFDIELLSGRLVYAVDWVAVHHAYPLGLFGASTGAAAALTVAARRPDTVRAVVSRGGRPDLAGPALTEVRAPTLLLVGGADETVLELNAKAAQVMGDRARLLVIPGATHLFPEPGALERVAEYAREWFDLYLDPSGPVVDDLA
ncbi:MAG TPA: dienelactone hydrolase family protein [Micromonosporaceae bacterium]|jgi:dienelactone hydrolase